MKKTNVNKPIEKEKIDWTEVKELAEEYINRLHEKGITSDDLSDYEEYIFEAVLEAVYGKEVWNNINPILEKL